MLHYFKNKIKIKGLFFFRNMRHLQSILPDSSFQRYEKQIQIVSILNVSFY